MEAKEEGVVSFWMASFPYYWNLPRQEVKREQALLDYFYFSSFYDRNCDNEACHMQNRTRSDDKTLKKMTGIQYYVIDHKEIGEITLAIIIKCKRISPKKTTPLAYYYIYNGIVFRAPYFMSVLSTRLCNALYSMNEAIHKLADDEQRLREEHLENAENLQKPPAPPVSAPVILSMKSLVEKFPIETQEVTRKRKLEDGSPAPSPKRQRIQ